MSDKVARVTLPHEVAEAIEDLRKNHYDNRALIDEIYEGTARPVLQAYAEANFDTLLNALVNGYEIEKSPEEKVREYYEFWSERARDRDYETRIEAENKLDGMLFVLNAYGIKIPGVNVDA